MLPGGVELLLITILALVIVFFAFAIKRGWYNQVFVVVVTLLGLLPVVLGVIKLLDDVEENNISGGLQVFVGLLMLLFSGYLQKKLAADKGEK